MKRKIRYACCLLPFTISGFSETQADDRPNILWLTYEDTSPQFIGCYGNTAAHTPVMDALNANGGVRFNYAYANGTVSSASRSGLITGIDANITGLGNHRYVRSLPTNIKGFPYYLRQAGYYTSNNVKTDYNISNSNFVTEAWNESSNSAHWRKRASTSTPFFSVFNIDYSHQSYASRNNYAYYTTNVYSKLDKSRETFPEEMIVPDFYYNDEEVRFQMARMQNCINYTDQIMGDYIKQLEDDGLKESTIIFIFADHGSGIPRGKTCAIGMGYRVPFIIWFPDKWKHLNPFEGNTVTDQQISFEDLAPTILSLAGVTPPAAYQGKNFLGNNNPSHPEYIYGFRNRIGESPGIERSVMKGRYVYTRVFSPYIPTVKNQGYDYSGDISIILRKKNHLGLSNAVQQEPFLPRYKEYLYDLETDIWETNNLATNPEYSELVDELRTEMVRYAKSIQDIGFIPEYEMNKRTTSTTPYALRNNYDFNSIIDVAMLVGEGPEVIPQQIELLSSTNKIIRYWAALGIYNQGEQAVSFESQIRNAYNQESFDGAKIELAAFLYKFCHDLWAGNVLDAYARQSDELLANDAVTKIQYFGGEKTIHFKNLIDEIQPYWATNDANYCVSPNVNTTQIIIRNLLKDSFGEMITDGKTYSIRNASTGGYIGVKDSSTVANTQVLQTLNGTRDHVKWKLEKKDNTHYSLINANSSMALSMNPSSLANGAQPFQSGYSGNDGQLWLLEPYQYGYLLKNKATNKSLQVNGQSKNEGATIAQWDWNGNLHFNWVLELPIDSTTNIHMLNSDSNFARITSVFPNPLKKNNVLHINYNLHETATVDMSIFDLDGKCLLRDLLGTQIPGQYTHQLNLDKILISGVFLIKINYNTSSKNIKESTFIIVEK